MLKKHAVGKRNENTEIRKINTKPIPLNRLFLIMENPQEIEFYTRVLDYLRRKN
jgi:hypothetical protein